FYSLRDSDSERAASRPGRREREVGPLFSLPRNYGLVQRHFGLRSPREESPVREEPRAAGAAASAGIRRSVEPCMASRAPVPTRGATSHAPAISQLRPEEADPARAEATVRSRSPRRNRPARPSA